MSDGRRFVERQRLFGGLLLAVALGLLGSTVLLAVSMNQQTNDLESKVRLTQGIVDANMRTLTQVQRETLRLEALLSQAHPDPEAVELQKALVSQRVQEGSLSYQLQTLGTQDLLDQSRRLAERWSLSVEPMVIPSLGSGKYAAAEREDVLTSLVAMEKGYNRLVSDGESNRKAKLGQTNAATQDLVQRAHLLLYGLVGTFVAVLCFLGLAGLLYTRFHRQRERAGATLLALNHELRRYAQVVRSTDNMVVVTDAQGRVEWVNDAFTRATGFALDDVLGQRPGSLLQGPGSCPEAKARMRQALQREEAFTEEIVNYARDGRAYWVSLDVSPVHDEKGRLSGYVAVQTDITERKHADELLRAARDSAEESAREKANFLASMSHEIRTPLNAVLGLTDLLLLTDLDTVQRDYARTARTSGRLLLALVNDILDFSALEAGKLETEHVPVALESLVHDTITMFSAEAERRGLRLGYDMDPGLPAAVLGDEMRLRQVLVNLIGNALKFTEQGEVTLRVRSRTAPDGGDQLLLEVTDTGIGIPPDRLDRLFLPFSQVDASTTRRYGGTGLGLAICRLVVDALGGTISVESTPAAGSTFTVCLPMEAAASTQAPQVPATRVESPRSMSQLRVLLAEDDRVNQMVAVHMLHRLGVAPVVVSDGQAAVDAALSDTFDVVLMDVHMPMMDGVEAAAAIRAGLPPEQQPRIVAITANAMEGDRERLLGSGMDAYLSKPVQLADLVRRPRRRRGRLSPPPGGTRMQVRVPRGARRRSDRCPVLLLALEGIVPVRLSGWVEVRLRGRRDGSTCGSALEEQGQGGDQGEYREHGGDRLQQRPDGGPGDHRRRRGGGAAHDPCGRRHGIR